MNSLLFRGLKSLTFVRFRSDANAKHSPQFRQRNQNFAPKPHSPPSYKQCEHGSRLSNSGVKLSLESLSGSQFLAKKCSGVGIPRSVFQTAAKRFGQQVLRGKADITVNTLAKTLMEQSVGGPTRIILPYLFRYIQKEHPKEISVLFEDLLSLSDLRSPTEWFPQARTMKRKIIMHVGPTNSGKTYHALQRFQKAESAVYCGPLRLLAQEVYERSNEGGVPCNLLTGEERRESDGVDKWSCTVEMTNLNSRFDVAVIDEIQMIGDDQRGWAWTSAVLVHLCGEPTAVELVKTLLEDTEDEIEVRTYERLTGLAQDERSLHGKMANVKAGDCVVAFSRKDIFALKQVIEKNTRFKAAVIYGGLPAESRSEQARLFNGQIDGYNVLVASDAIGMGLNLNIRRVVFDALSKFNGTETVDLSISQAKQIAGRAGRFNTQWPNGLVTCVEQRMMKKLATYLESTPPAINAAGLLPTADQLESFSKILPQESMSGLLSKFQDLATLDGNFQLCNIESLCSIADAIEHIKMPIRDRYTFMQAPCSHRDEVCLEAFIDMAKHHAGESIFDYEKHARFENQPVPSAFALRSLESRHKVIMMYLWMSVRYPVLFPHVAHYQMAKSNLEGLINDSLSSIDFSRTRKFRQYERRDEMKAFSLARDKQTLSAKKTPKVVSVDEDRY